jgi:hypothetical protein
MDTYDITVKESPDFDRLILLERRIEELEKKLSLRTEQILDEDLKVRGMK